MKSIPAALQAHYNSGGLCVAPALLIHRQDGKVFAFTGRDVPLVMDVAPWGIDEAEQVFDCTQGLDVSGIVSTAGFNVDNLEITTLDEQIAHRARVNVAVEERERAKAEKAAVAVSATRRAETIRMLFP